MRLTRMRRRLRGDALIDRATWQRLATCQAASISVEFCIALSALLLIYVHLVDFSRAFEEKERVAKLSGTLSNLVAQQPTSKPLAGATLDAIFDATASIMTPFSPDNVTTTVSIVDVVPRADLSCCDANVRWTVTRRGTLRPCRPPLQQVPSNATPLPENILAAMVNNAPLTSTAGAELVIADVRDQYRPMFGILSALFSGGFGKTTYAIPRAAGTIDLEKPPQLVAPDQVQICQ